MSFFGLGGSAFDGADGAQGAPCQCVGRVAMLAGAAVLLWLVARRLRA